MCGNGKSCDECGRGPCGPSINWHRYDGPDRCETCCGTGGWVMKRRGEMREFWEECTDCRGTGKARKK